MGPFWDPSCLFKDDTTYLNMKYSRKPEYMYEREDIDDLEKQISKLKQSLYANSALLQTK